jgi:putative hydrolase of HD superfamily
MKSIDPERLLECCMELHALTKLRRTGWLLAGVPEAESVGDHCFEAAVFAILLSKQEEVDVDIGRVLQMLLFHEVAEARITDLPRRSKDYMSQAKRLGETEAAKDILSGVAEDIIDLLEEMHQKKTVEARLAEAAEELQIIFRSMVYAKECRGDMSEYRRDVENYDDFGFPTARLLANAIGEKLEQYLAGKPYWEIGYSKRPK